MQIIDIGSVIGRRPVDQKFFNECRDVNDRP
jgi:hypothetical protein